MLCVIDGGTGLRKALGDVLGELPVVQRCQVHKRNVRDYLAKNCHAYVNWRDARGLQISERRHGAQATEESGQVAGGTGATRTRRAACARACLGTAQR
jgi:hypothetical protein